MESTRAMTVDELAEQNADELSSRTGISRDVAAKRLRFVAQAILDGMEVGEEEAFPIPSGLPRNGGPHVFVVTKRSKRKLEITKR